MSLVYYQNMPVTRSARKKLRQDKVRRLQNNIARVAVKNTVKRYKKTPSVKRLTEVFSVLDKAVKKKIFHPNKAARLKSSLSKLLKKQSPEVAKTVPESKTPKKSAKK